MRLSIVIFFTFLFSLGLSAQQAVLECLTVGDVTGAVSLRFSYDGNATAFNIYRADNINGNYQMIHTTSSGIFTSFVDASVNAASQSYSYYVEAISNGQNTGASNKLSSMLLTANDLNNGLVELNWNETWTNSGELFQVWRKYSMGEFILLATTHETSRIDTLDHCQGNYNYQIRILTEGCVSTSNLRGGNFGDIIPPETVIPKNATIDTASGDIILSWFLPSEDNADIKKYQIWVINANGGSTQFPQAEVYGYNNLSVRLDPGLACDTALTFSITAQDSCGNSSVWNQEYFIRTLNMKNPEYDICNDICEIRWDSILSWHDMPVSGINVYQKKDYHDFEIIRQLNPDATSVMLTGFERDVIYQFYIEAYSEDQSRKATSCIKRIIGKKPVATEYTWLRSASVIQGEVKLKWEIDSIAYVPQYAVLRSEDGFDFSIIDTVYGNQSTVQYYHDLGSKYYQDPQYYRIQAFDSCLNIGLESNDAITMYTKVSSYSDGQALVEWTPYSKMDSILYYQVYRVIDTLIYPFPIADISPDGELSYVDDYQNAVPLSADLGYFIEAVGYFSDSMPEPDSARSNTNFLARVTNVFVPTGFKPQGGVTEIFIPIYTGIKSTNYNFKILNRWGMMIFESHQPVLGWDGKYKGDYVLSGAYLYVLEYETIYGKTRKQSGLFYILY